MSRRGLTPTTRLAARARTIRDAVPAYVVAPNATLLRSRAVGPDSW